MHGIACIRFFSNLVYKTMTMKLWYYRDMRCLARVLGAFYVCLKTLSEFELRSVLRLISLMFFFLVLAGIKVPNSWQFAFMRLRVDEDKLFTRILPLYVRWLDSVMLLDPNSNLKSWSFRLHFVLWSRYDELNQAFDPCAYRSDDSNFQDGQKVDR